MELDATILVNRTSGTVICGHLQLATTVGARTRGLLGRDALPSGEGLLLEPAPSIHTMFMRFPIDVVFTDRDLRVVKLVENMRPWRMASCRQARSVIELAAGEIAGRQIAVGEQLEVLEVRNEPDPAAEQKPTPRATALRTGPAPTPVGADGPRVLVVGSDRRFRSLAGALLVRRGCAVTVATQLSEAAELVRRDRIEAVVLIASQSLTEAACRAAQLETIEPPVGVVVVEDAAECRLETLPKWGPFEDLFEAVERAASHRGVLYDSHR